MCQIKMQKSRILFHEMFNSANRKLIFEKYPFWKFKKIRKNFISQLLYGLSFTYVQPKLGTFFGRIFAFSNFSKKILNIGTFSERAHLTLPSWSIFCLKSCSQTQMKLPPPRHSLNKKSLNLSHPKIQHVQLLYTQHIKPPTDIAQATRHSTQL